MSRRRDAWHNWGRNLTAKPAMLARPADEDEVAHLIGLAIAGGHKVRPVGSGHSFSPIVPTDGVLLDLGNFSDVISVDRASNRITVGAGIPLHELNKKLRSLGLALPNLGDIDAQTLAGATATGTHGTGSGFQAISAAVVGARLVTGDGGVIGCSTDDRPDLLDAVRVSLGALGIVTQLTLQCVPAFNLHAHESTLDIDELLEAFDETAAANDHVEFYWFPHTRTGQLKVNNRTDEPLRRRKRISSFWSDEVLANGGFELVNRLGRRRPGAIPGLLSRLVTPGDRREFVEPSHEVFCSRRRVRFVEMEYAVPRDQLLDAFAEVRELIPTLSHPVSFPLEIRVLGSDDIPLSPASERDTGFIAVHLYRGTPHDEYFSAVEDIMRGHQARPHWGKLHTRTAADLAPLYPRWDTFQRALDELDPDGHFANDYTTRVLRGDEFVAR